jgi:peptide deformylase
MAVLPIARMGQPVLRRRALPVADPTAAATRRLAADMIETMEAAPGVGLAAPQVFQPLRLIVFKLPEARQGEGEERLAGTHVLVNPEIEGMDPAPGEEPEYGIEGCLSVPGLRGVVPRARRIRYRGFDLAGNRIERVATGFHARVVQHEYDHLDGHLYLDRLAERSHLFFESETQAALGALAGSSPAL